MPNFEIRRAFCHSKRRCLAHLQYRHELYYEKNDDYPAHKKSSIRIRYLWYFSRGVPIDQEIERQTGGRHHQENCRQAVF